MHRIDPPHRLICDLHAPGAVVQLGGDMLKEAIEELVANARAAMPAGGEVRLSTRWDMRDEAGGRRHVVVAISDDGLGMDHGTLAKAREPFFTKRQVGDGVGLGLSLVDGVVRIAGGELRLRSDAGHGTTVELMLPAV